MTMRFAYELIGASSPIVALGGRYSRPRPIVPITVIGSSGSHLMEGLVDSGADEIIFPELVAAIIGVDLSGAVSLTTRGIGGIPVSVRIAEVTLRIADPHEHHEWSAWVGFSPIPRRTAILGFAGFLQYFTTILYGDFEMLELTVNALYPGI